VTVRVLAATELDVAAQLLAGGAVVGVPTDTVYGLAAAVGIEAAIAALFAAKRRPGGVPIAVLCATLDEAASLATTWSDVAERLARRFWPGPLTVVVDAAPELSSRLGAGHGVGVRVPADPTCLELLGRTGPLAVTSANLHGEPPSTTAAQFASAFAATEVRAVVDDGPRHGEVSSVIDVTCESIVVVREAALSRDVLLSVVSET
jgi:L-threonylcarbamoyladenylate synthase